MADVKISALPVATTPLTGLEVLPIVQSGVTRQVSVNNLTAGKTVAASTVNVDANTASAAVRITQTGAGNALLVEDSANPDATPFVVNANGAVGIGTTNTDGGLLLVASDSFTAASVSAHGLSASPFAVLRRSNGSMASPTIVTNGMALGTQDWRGYDGTQYVQAASISAVVDGTPGTNDMPGRLVFSTTADGASSPTERMWITSAGNVGIGTASTLAPLTIASASADPILALNATGTQANAITFYRSGSATGAVFQTNAGAINIFNTVAQPVIFATSSTERMRIDASGNVGIGTASPVARLDLGSIVHGTPASGITASFWNLSGNSFGIGVSSNQLNYIAGITTSNSHVWYSNGTERMRITATGNVVAGASVALATTATDGFLYVPTCAGVPTGTPTAITGMAPIVVNTTNNKLYFYSGGAWRDAGP